jgi:hypothetical protein
MSLMFAKQFSEAGVSTTSGKKGGRGKSGGGLMSKSKRGARRDQDDAGDSSGGLFNMDPNAPYRTHMLFPGRKDDDSSQTDPRRSSGSPSFMKAMMSWGKRPSDPRAQQAQELARYRGTPTKPPESEFDPVDPFYRKTVSFHDGRPLSPGSPPLPGPDRRPPGHLTVSSPYHPGHPGQPSYLPTSSRQDFPTNKQNGHQPHFSYPEPYKENDYAAFAGGRTTFLLTHRLKGAF